MDTVALLTGDSESSYRRLVQGITDYAIYMLDLDGTVVSWNAGAERAKGYTAAEIIGRNFKVFYTPEDQAAGLPQRALAIARTTGKFETDGWRLRKNGSRMWARVVIDAIYGDAGELIGFAKITRDRTEQHALRESSQANERRFRLLVEGVADYAIYMLDPAGHVSNWNAGAQRAKGYVAAEIVGQHFSRFYTPQDRAAGLPERALQAALNEGKFEGEGWRLRKDGTRFWAFVVINRINNEDGSLLGFAKITRDLTEQKQNKERVAEMTRRLDLALANMPQGLCLFGTDERLILCNDSFRRMFNIADGASVDNHTLLELLTMLHAGGACIDAKTGLDQTPAELRKKHLALLEANPAGVLVEENWQGKVIASTHRKVEGGWLTTMHEITEQRAVERQITYLAHHDTLTALPNRLRFQQCLFDILAPASGAAPVDARSCALLYLDLDRFKPINDTLGHDAGDALLKAVADRICGLLRKRDLVGRLGGDEFVVLQVGCEQPHDTDVLAERLIREISRPYIVKGLEVSVGVSVGIALTSADALQADHLLQHADMALYKAKQDGRGCHRYYDHTMEAKIRTRLDMERDLSHAVAAGEFELHYQPVVNLARDAVSGFEALLRWNCPTRGHVSPANFVPLAEETGLMPGIGDWVLRTACREALSWPAHLIVSVNLSPAQFARPDLVETVKAALDDTGLPPVRLELEVTETAMIHNLDSTTATLNRLRAMGIRIALDDFGTGYSSLSFVQSLPFTRIKIDQSFVQTLGDRPESIAIIRAVAGLCNSLGVASTAEGVETEQQAKMLLNEHCTDLQGFLVSRPCPAGDVLDWLHAFNRKATDAPLDRQAGYLMPVSG